ncbi:thymidylate kinase-domain-containing protein [Naematelia encephala]|uniref:Thymidylate kinase n=1 Tax=Naematelia encephala TaxID=71784 RepID=A0A1Y2BEE4_9TREE|nr:thymidylate kinase-domain-containing protein [Naematelia encephala]
MMAPRGAFIVFEGLDRSGKTTQVQRLVQRLEADGRAVRLQKFPDRTTSIGRMIDSYLQTKSDLDDRAIHLLFSANRWECANAIERDLAQGVTVIADRYGFSGIAFSAAKGLPFSFCLQPDTGLPLPDSVIYLTVNPEVAASRAAYGLERYETKDIQTRVRERFDEVANEVQRRHGNIWHTIDASGSVDDVQEKVWAAVTSTLNADFPSMGRLWM